MFSRKKPEPTKRRNHDLSQFGLTEIPDDFDPTVGYGNHHDDGDSDLEAELAAITGDGGGKRKPRPKPKPQLIPDLDQMIADSLKDVGSDDDEGEDLENDTDLLGELNNIAGGDGGNEMEEDIVESEKRGEEGSPEVPQTFLPTTTVDTISIIQQRIEMYKQAEAIAKASGEGAKARRYGRGLKTLNDLLKQAKGGKTINVDDIPPEVSVKGGAKPETPSDAVTAGAGDGEEPPKVPSRAAPAPPSTPSSPQTAPTTPSPKEPSESVAATEEVAPKPASPENTVVDQLRTRQREYKAAALQSKRSGDTAAALQFLKVVKQFDIVIKMYEEGQTVDLSDMPPPPDQFMEFMEKMQAAAEAPAAQDAPSTPKPDPPPAATADTANTGGDAAGAPTSMLEALQQRLDKYKSVEESAKAEGNSSKARRFGRIVKQYEDAVKTYKAGRQVAYDELPVPPGFGPLPVENAGASSGAPAPTPPPVAPKPKTTPVTSPTATTNSRGDSPGSTSKGTAPHDDLTTRTSGNQQKNNLAEQQMKTLLERQKEFKLAAIEAKKAGEIEQAKEYLKIYKGFDSLLNAASSGLPVDMSTLPLPPSQRENLEASFAIVSTDECDPDDDMSDIGVRIEEQLAKQLMMCKNTRDHHKAMGDVAGMNRFENLAVTVQKDLDLVRYSKRKNYPLPKFHYEKRSFNIVHCNTDLTDNELEIVVVRGLSYNVANPKDVDTYIKIECPLTNDEAFSEKTPVVKNTDSPDYDQRFKVDIIRGNRQWQRIFKRHGVKFEVYSRGGFLRSDTLIGTVNVKLQPLETKCDVHDTFDLMNGRKIVGGKLEIKLRVRNPILTKQVEHIDEKWLVIDH